MHGRESRTVSFDRLGVLIYNLRDIMTDDLAGVAARGAKLLTFAQVAKFAIYLLGLVTLSRLLDPSAFGIVAIATAFVGVAEYLRDFGLSTAAVRERYLSVDQRDALFWTNLGLGFFFTIVISLLAPLLAAAFGIPELSGVLALLSLTFVINGFGAQYRASLNRDQQYSRIAIVDILGPAFGLVVALLAVFAGASYWSLAIQFLANSLVTSGLLVFFGRWRARRPRRVTGVRRLYTFGANYAVSQLVGYLGNNVHTIALGLFGTPASVGVYTRSFQFALGTLDQAKAPALTVALPSLARVSHDLPRMSSFLLRGQLLIAYVTLPLAAFMFAGSGPIVNVLLGRQWVNAGPVIAVLALAGALQQLATVSSWLFVTAGNANGLRNYMFLSTSLKIVGVLSFVSYGAFGVAIGYTAAVAVAWPIAIIWSTRSSGARTAPLLVQGIRLLAVGIVAAAAGKLIALSLALSSTWVEIFVAFGVVAATYLLSAVFAVFRADFRQVARVVRLSVRRKSE